MQSVQHRYMMYTLHQQVTPSETHPIASASFSLLRKLASTSDHQPRVDNAKTQNDQSITHLLLSQRCLFLADDFVGAAVSDGQRRAMLMVHDRVRQQIRIRRRSEEEEKRKTKARGKIAQSTKHITHCTAIMIGLFLAFSLLVLLLGATFIFLPL